ncbi:MAG: hypothetical protein KDA98_16715 [Acidimicrobiales bacterium]|nr:hypothetical protein [Acidimicrobiales bacterium]
MTSEVPEGGSTVHEWEAARSHPHTYPGACPAGSFVMVDEAVHRLVVAPAGLGASTVDFGESTVALEQLLEDRGLARIEDRVPVVAYGGNRNPGTIALKCRHYDYRSPGEGDVFVALRATMRGVDVVAGGLSDQGYLYADLFVAPEVADTEVDVWVLLLDREGLRMIHDSEGVTMGAYVCARFGGLQVDGVAGEVEGLAYAGALPVFRSPELDGPMAFASVSARGRVLSEFATVDMLDHALGALGLRQRAGELVGVGDHAELGAQVMKFLNGQFWYRRNTGDRRIESAEALEMAIWEGLLGQGHPLTTADAMRARGAVLATETAYDPPDDLTVGAWWRP